MLVEDEGGIYRKDMGTILWNSMQKIQPGLTDTGKKTWINRSKDPLHFLMPHDVFVSAFPPRLCASPIV